MEHNKTIVYYSSNREPWEFESKVIEHIKMVSGGLPVVSVTQKPIDFGKNICIGEKDLSYQNCYRQLYLACLVADTEYVISCESDCLYPPEYFQYDPNGNHLCRYINLWILFSNKPNYYNKEYSECGQIANRRYLIDAIDSKMSNMTMWGNGAPEIPYKKRHWHTFTHENPIINVKTGQGVWKTTGTSRMIEPKTELPYWGNVSDLKKKFGLT